MVATSAWLVCTYLLACEARVGVGGVRAKGGHGVGGVRGKGEHRYSTTYPAMEKQALD